MRSHGAKTNPLALAVVLFLALGTLIAGNHCALGGMKLAPAADHSCCATPAKTTPSSPASGYAECCASLAAPLPAQAAAPAVQFLESPAAWLPLADALASAIDTPQPSLCGHAQSPPGPPSLCELVLSRSLPAHAPPSSFA